MISAMATWILTYTLHSVVLCAVALAAVRFRRVDPATRCVVLRGAMFLPFATATLAVLSSNTTMPGVGKPLSVTSPVRRLFPPSVGMQKVELKVTAINGRPPERVVEVSDPVGTASARLIVLLAIVASAGGLALQRLRTRRVRRALTERTPAQIDLPLVEQHGIRITQSNLIDVPLALRGKEICIPARSLAGMGIAERRSVILHEIAHVERNDPAWMDASRIVCAGTRWQPLNRLVCEALERETEIAADQRAIALGARPHALVAGLAHFAGLVNAGYAGAGAALLRGDSPLVPRARLLLDPPVAPSNVRVGYVWAAILSIAASSALMPIPTTASPTPSFEGESKSGVQQMIEEERVFKLSGNQRQP